jgi:hypothetical protein
MNDWQKDLFSMIENIGTETERFFQDVQEIAETVVEEIADLVIFVSEEIEADFEDFWRFFLEPIDDQESWEIEEVIEEIIENPELSLNPKIEPTLDNHPACLNCRNYHGRVYNGVLLVCGMHPYGWMDENCPDWEDEDQD